MQLFLLLGSVLLVHSNFFFVSRQHIPRSTTSADLLGKFHQASGCPLQVGLSNLCRFRTDGGEEVRPHFPFQARV